MSNSPTVGFIGAGKMASAIASGICRGETTSSLPICFYDPLPEAAENFRKVAPSAESCESGADVCQRSDVLILAVKPQVLPQIATDLRESVAETLMISVAAGHTLDSLASWLDSHRVIRVMPNTPCLVGQGVSGFCTGKAVTEEDQAICEQIFGSVGECIEVTEAQLEAITGMSGSGPAYVFSMIEALADGGVLVGLPRAQATRLAIQTVLGSAALAQQAGEHPAILREQVTSPGGTTARGLQALDEHGFKAGVIAAVQASAEWSRELGKTKK